MVLENFFQGRGTLTLIVRLLFIKKKKSHSLQTNISYPFNLAKVWRTETRMSNEIYIHLFEVDY